MLRQTRILGLKSTVSNIEETANKIIEDALESQGGYICVSSVHQLVTAKLEEDLGKILNEAKIVTADGMPIVWVQKKQGFCEAERVSGPDLTPLLLEKAEANKVPVYFYGGTQKKIEVLKEKL